MIMEIQFLGIGQILLVYRRRNVVLAREKNFRRIQLMQLSLPENHNNLSEKGAHRITKRRRKKINAIN